MNQSPSYLGGLAEIEPHYYRPVVPEYLQSIVSNTPLDRGDGIPTVAIPQPIPSPIPVAPMANAAQMQQIQRPSTPTRNFGGARNFGAPCLPCQAATSGRTPSYRGFFKNLLGSNAVQNVITWGKDQLADMPEDQKAQLKSSIIGAASMTACEKYGLFCPEQTTTDTGETESKPPIGIYIAVGVLTVAVLGGSYMTYKTVSNMNKRPLEVQ